MKRHEYRGTSFDIPANKKFWKQCGDYDSLIQFEECCHRALLERYKEEKRMSIILRKYRIAYMIWAGIY